MCMPPLSSHPVCPWFLVTSHGCEDVAQVVESSLRGSRSVVSYHIIGAPSWGAHISLSLVFSDTALQRLRRGAGEVLPLFVTCVSHAGSSCLARSSA